MYQPYHNLPSQATQFELPIFGSRKGSPNVDSRVFDNLRSPFPLIKERFSLVKTDDGTSDPTTLYVRPYSALIKSLFGSVELRRVQTDVLILERIRVIPSMQNLGIGTELMNRALASADRVNCNVLARVECYEPGYELSRLLKFFSRFWFNIVASETGYALMVRHSLSQRENINV